MSHGEGLIASCDDCEALEWWSEEKIGDLLCDGRYCSRCGGFFGTAESVPVNAGRCVIIIDEWDRVRDLVVRLTEGVLSLRKACENPVEDKEHEGPRGVVTIRDEHGRKEKDIELW